MCYEHNTSYSCVIAFLCPLSARYLPTHLCLDDVPGVGDPVVAGLVVVQHPLLHVGLQQVLHLKTFIEKVYVVCVKLKSFKNT